ncbi:two component regulator propeller domain-containing protein [Flavobacterium cauense R2A-7]|uniref:Two component regulator with propeller domain n=1 Tax=Flavobacterium cauense R2A-7 TaxID=1341154 RepID=V6RWN1_9FLAO|nr:two-component regulator propeller domain-containing protein [Flavobacterium cauense]ESU18883.1 two component regulator propeller domain-containing protein [Flavobacterium cauense R2A-7]KGO81650.1 regulator [Flavobacterium cauense R2A-7]TWI13679.1 two component regulator with propeller domain [Flavobacterium cauense R2A-7]
MKLSKIILLSLLIIFTLCNCQVTTNRNKDSIITFKPIPTLIRNPTHQGISPDFDTSLVSQYIRSIFQDSKGNLWFGTLGDGVVRYDVKSLTYFAKSEGLDANSIHAITEDKNGNIWLGTDQGVFKYDGKEFRNYNEKNGLKNITVSRKSILIDKSNTIWVGTESGVFRYNASVDNANEKCFSLFPLLASIKIRDIMEDKAGNIWFASQDNGVYRFDGKTIINITENEGLGDNYAGGMIQDKTGNFWFTMKGGICRYDGKNFTNFTTKDGLGGNEVWGIYEEKSGIIWISARGSMTRYDPSANVMIGEKPFTIFTEKDGINCCVQSMYQDRSGNMWWGAGSGLYRFDGERFYQVKQKGPW